MSSNNFFETKSGTYRAVNKIALPTRIAPDNKKASTPVVSRLCPINRCSCIVRVPKDELVYGTYSIT